MEEFDDGVEAEGTVNDSNYGDNASDFQEKDEDEGSEYQLEAEDRSDGGDYDDGDNDSDYASDDSEYNRRRKSKRKRGAQQDGRDGKRERREPQNEMQKKLRSARTHQEEEAEDADEFEPSLRCQPTAPQVVEPPPIVLKRTLTQEEIDADLNTIGPMWEMACVLDFLHRFQDQLKLSNKEFTPNDLAYELVVGTGHQGLLAQLHVDLLRGLSSKSDLNHMTWQGYAALKVRGMAVSVQGVPTLLFDSVKGEEPQTYCAMPTPQRVLLLKAICELRCDRDDIRLRIEFAVNPKKAKQMMAEKHVRGRAPVLSAEPETINDFRAQPVGVDSYGWKYWFVDFMHSTETLLYKECPPDPPPSPPPLPKTKAAKTAGRKTKGRGKPQPISLGGTRVPDQQPGDWALMATTAEDLQDVADDLMKTRKRADVKLAKWIYEDILSLLDTRKAELERKAKLAEKLRRQIGNVLPDEEGGYGRPRRERKKVNYNTEEYDNMINEAIRNTKRGPEQRPTRTRAAAAPVDAGAARGTRRTRAQGGSLNEDDLSGGWGDEPQERRSTRNAGAAPQYNDDFDDEAEEAEEEYEEEANGYNDYTGGAQASHKNRYDEAMPQDEEEDAMEDQDMGNNEYEDPMGAYEGGGRYDVPLPPRAARPTFGAGPADEDDFGEVDSDPGDDGRNDAGDEDFEGGQGDEEDYDGQDSDWRN